LHLGHAYSALLAHDQAKAEGGKFLLRIEDIDSTRARAHWEAQIYDDLHWLGITWDGAPMRQSDRLPTYQQALEQLWARGLLYTCKCSRKDINAALSAPQEGAEPSFGPDGPVYPGTCRPSADTQTPDPGCPLPSGDALRLNMSAALAALDGRALRFEETNLAPGANQIPAKDLITSVGDIVLSRRDFPGSYHLSVVLDDAAQGITHVIRGADLFDATQIHVLLQQLLGLPTPTYTHHRLIRDDQGKRLAKRDDARAIARYREEGATPQNIRQMVGL
jgi:glutamyl-Q tRNA(Asp) synthetase